MLGVPGMKLEGECSVVEGRECGMWRCVREVCLCLCAKQHDLPWASTPSLQRPPRWSSARARHSTGNGLGAK